MKRLRTCDAAVLVLRETDNPAVMWGDENLLHMIAERAGLSTSRKGWQTSAAVLNNLAKQTGDLVAGYTRIGSNRLVRIFWLPEKTP